MGFNLGIMAGAAADGFRKQNEEMRKQADEKRRDEEAKREAEYQKELEKLPTPDAEYRAKLAEHEARQKAQAGTAKTAADVVAAQGSAPVYQAEPRTFAESVAQNRGALPLAPEQPAGRAPFVAGNGLSGAIKSALNEPVKPDDAPTPPGLPETLGYISQRAAIDMKYGKINGVGMMQLMQATKQLEEEGVKDALLKFHSGDIQGGADAFNQGGKRRVKVIESKPSEVDVGGVKLPTTLVTVEDEQGNRQTINPAQTLHSMMGLEKQLEQAFRMNKDKRDAESQAEQRRHNLAVEGIARDKADKEKRPSYKTEAGDITALLGTPAVDGKGRPVIDPITGRQSVNRNTAREQQFFRYMKENGLTDTNEALQKFMQEAPTAAPVAANRPPLSSFQK